MLFFNSNEFIGFSEPIWIFSISFKFFKISKKVETIHMVIEK